MTQEHTFKEMGQRSYLDSVLDGTLKLQRTQLSINIFLTEKFLGKCWHVFGNREMEYKNYNVKHCTKCGVLNMVQNSDLFTPTGFFLLWEKAQGEEWWKGFKIRYGCWSADADIWVLPEDRINPLTFPILLAEFIGWGKP